jgi:3-methyladenine DNA glycosylase AlkD
MRLEEAMQALEAAGSEKTRKTYSRHGVGENQFGVNWNVLRDLAKKIKTDQGLARELWATGNYDARILATLIGDPKQATDEEIEGWSRDLDNYPLSDAFAVFLARTPRARQIAEPWLDADREWVSQTGWYLVSALAMRDKNVSEEWLADLLRTIERDIHGRQNRVRHAMNMALIAIALKSPALREQAVAAAGKIGKVEVDHGETGCVTPDAIAYIAKAEARKAKGGKSKAS